MKTGRSSPVRWPLSLSLSPRSVRVYFMGRRGVEIDPLFSTGPSIGSTVWIEMTCSLCNWSGDRRQ